MSPKDLIEKDSKQPIRKKFVLKKRENLKILTDLKIKTNDQKQKKKQSFF